MLKQVVIFLFLAVSGYAVDPTIYKNCSQLELCNTRRELERQDRYEVNLEGSTYSQGVATFRVQSTEGVDLLLNITAIVGNIFRIQLEEADSTRYHLENVLDEEPEIIDFDDVQLTLTTATIVVGDSRVEVTTSPFSVELYTDDILQLVLDGDRVTLDNNELSTPFTFGVRFPQAAKLYGLHEHADHLVLRTTEPGGSDPYRVKTLDLTNFDLFSTYGMYGAIPVIYGHGVTSTSGLFLHNAAELFVEITNSEDDGGEAYFMVDSGAFDLFVMLGPSIVEVVRQYASLTGVAHLPPIWSLGYHQCRWGYLDQQDVQTVIADLDRYDFPVDAIWLDIQHTDDMKFFTWNTGNFSNPFEMLQNLSSTNRYLVTLSDPHFKVEEGYFVYDEGIAGDFFIKNPNGTIFEDECWPGLSVWMDYLNPDARDYYSSLYSYEKWNGTTSTLGGIWNDMNEAAIFDEPIEKTFPYDVVHYGGVSHRNVHNMYGYLQTMATHKGLVDRDNGALRPFILTRAHFAGSQKYAAFWTGDNEAEWDFVYINYPMCLNANLLGISFCGADVGGFYRDPPDEMLERFYQAGAWLPFFREHGARETERREPYLFDQDVQSVIRDAIKQRYAHLPVWYTVFYEHTRNGDPVIRPLVYHYPTDPDVFEIDDQLLLGSDILVKIIAEPGVDSVQVYFPGGEDLLWFPADLSNDFYRGTGYQDVPVTIENLPVYYREGSIIPTKQTSRPSTTDMKDDEYTVIAILDENTNASGTVYIDDNLSFEYRDFQRYGYYTLQAYNGNFVASLIDDSDSADFGIVIAEVITLAAIKGEDGSLTGEYVKKVYNRTADGLPLSSIKGDGRSGLIAFRLE